MWHIYFLQNKQQAKNKRATLSNIIQQQNITLKKINNMKNIFLLLLFTIVTLIAKAQNTNFDSLYLKEGAYIFEDLLKIQKSELFTTYKSQFGLATNDEMRINLDLEQEHQRFFTKFDQFHKGYLVSGATMNVHGQNDVVLRCNGLLIKNLNVNVTNPISESEALARALSNINASKYLWEDDISEQDLKTERGQEATYYPKGKLIISKKYGPDVSYNPDNFKLCWQFNITRSDTAKTITILVDAISGTIFDIPKNSVEDYYTTGDVCTWYDGFRPIETRTCWACSNYRLVSSPSKKIETYYWDNGSRKIMKDGNNNWYENQIKTGAVVHWGIERSLNYFLNRHGRWGSNYNGKPFAAETEITGSYLNMSYVHSEDDFDLIQVRPDYSNPAAALDVIGHEAAHAFIKNNASNIGQYGDNEASTLREGFADIFGILIERSVNGTTDWKFGEDVGLYTRKFADPHNDIPYPAPELYNEPTYWYSYANSDAIYRNSGIIRKWFYLYSEGTNGATINGQNFSGLGIEEATDIAYLCVNWWFWSNLTIKEAAQQTIYAMKYVHGECSPQHKQAYAAWRAVGITNLDFPLCKRFGIQSYDVINHNDISLNSDATKFTIRPINTNELPSNGTYVWDLPSAWNVTFNGTSFTLNSTTNYESQIISVSYVVDGNVVERTSKVVHFSNQENSNKNAPLNDMAEKKLAIIYPNPATNFVTINLPNKVNNAKVEIINLEGKVIFSQSNITGYTTLNTESYSNGIYIVKVSSAELNEISKLTIKH